MQERLIQEMTAATDSVMATMMGITAVPGAPIVDSPGPGPIGGVSAMVGIVGPWVGTGAVSCDEPLACLLAGRMLMSEYTEINEEVLDAIGEIANMIIGNVKTNLEASYGPLALGVPTVTYGRDFATRSMVKQSWLMVPFDCEGRQLFIQMQFTDAAHLPQAHHHAHLSRPMPRATA